MHAHNNTSAPGWHSRIFYPQRKSVTSFSNHGHAGLIDYAVRRISPLFCCYVPSFCVQRNVQAPMLQCIQLYVRVFRKNRRNTIRMELGSRLRKNLKLLVLFFDRSIQPLQKEIYLELREHFSERGDSLEYFV